MEVAWESLRFRLRLLSRPSNRAAEAKWTVSRSGASCNLRALQQHLQYLQLFFWCIACIACIASWSQQKFCTYKLHKKVLQKWPERDGVIQDKSKKINSTYPRDML